MKCMGVQENWSVLYCVIMSMEVSLSHPSDTLRPRGYRDDLQILLIWVEARSLQRQTLASWGDVGYFDRLPVRGCNAARKCILQGSVRRQWTGRSGRLNLPVFIKQGHSRHQQFWTQSVLKPPHSLQHRLSQDTGQQHHLFTESLSTEQKIFN